MLVKLLKDWNACQHGKLVDLERETARRLLKDGIAVLPSVGDQQKYVHVAKTTDEKSIKHTKKGDYHGFE